MGRKKGLQVYLDPSGYTAYAPNKKKSGANGLIIDSKGNLLIAQHGDRRIAKINAPLDIASEFITVVDRFQGQRFHSPNDLILSRKGSLFSPTHPMAFRVMKTPFVKCPTMGSTA